MDGMPEEVQLPPDVGIKPMAKDLEEEVVDLKMPIEARGHRLQKAGRFSKCGSLKTLRAS